MKIHFIGSRGVSMKRLMEITRSLGVSVSGSDIIDGHNASAVIGADAVVYSSAVDESNEELRYARQLGIPTLERARFLGELATFYGKTYSVAGSHGKTTCTAMLYQVFSAYNPTAHIGGNYEPLNHSTAPPSRDIFITEACEYRRSFLSLRSTVGIITNIELDHTDYYESIDDIVSAFEQFSQNCDCVIVNGDDENCAKLCHSNIITVGYGQNCNFRAINPVRLDNGCYKFGVTAFGAFLGEIVLSVAGKHNVINSLLVTALALMQGLNFEQVRSAFTHFYGVSRRGELLYNDKFKIYTDYAHHPTEITATIDALKSKTGKTIVVFQPHTYSRTLDLMDGFSKCFVQADTLALCPVFASREKRETVTSIDLLNKISAPTDRHYYDKFPALFDFLQNKVKSGDTVLFLGAGDIDTYARQFANKIKDGL